MRTFVKKTNTFKSPQFLGLGAFLFAFDFVVAGC